MIPILPQRIAMSQLQGTPHSVASMKANGHHNGDQTIQKLGRIRAGSLGHKQAESHAPTLKNQGKSDCTVRIVGISECETDIPIDSLSQEDDGMATVPLCSSPN